MPGGKRKKVTERMLLDDRKRKRREDAETKGHPSNREKKRKKTIPCITPSKMEGNHQNCRQEKKKRSRGDN